MDRNTKIYVTGHRGLTKVLSGLDFVVFQFGTQRPSSHSKPTTRSSLDDCKQRCQDLSLRSPVLAMENYSGNEMINVGVGKEISINDLAAMLAELTGFDGQIVHDETKPDGTPSKVMDVSKLKNLGWEPEVSLKEGLKMTIEDFRENYLDFTND